MASRRMTHMISFRVSQHEFELLRAKSQAEGARSISDYARLTLARDPKETRQVLDDLQQLRSDVHRLTELLSDRGVAVPPPDTRRSDSIPAAKARRDV